MAATDPTRPLLGSIVAAALALPGVLHAEEAPTDGVIAFKISTYDDGQTGAYLGRDVPLGSTGRASIASATGKTYATLSRASGGGSGGGGSGSSNDYDRISVRSPSLYTLVPLGRSWSAEASLTVDEVSGASPQYYSDMRSAANVVDKRKAGDFKLTHYGERQTYALGLAHSSESDYVSNALSAEGRWASADQNTTWNAGLGFTSDRIDPTTHIVSNESKRTVELQGGVTQALSARDLVQATLTLSRATGYLNDPYKLYDARPDHRNAEILQLRWNHWLGGSAVKMGYRYYTDSYKVAAHTFDLAWAMPLGPNVTLTPGLRYYTQGAASFYVDPTANGVPLQPAAGSLFSADQRLAAWGALSTSLKLEWQLAPRWKVDGRVEMYRQKGSLQLGGQGSAGLNALHATIWQWGLSHSF